MPFNENETLNYLIQEEHLEVSWSSRLIGRKSKIFTTSDLAKQYKKQFSQTEKIKIFEPYKLNFILLAIVGIFFIIALIFSLINQIKPGDTANVFIPFAIIFVLVGILSVFFDKKRNFKISLSKDMLIVKDITYSWKEIYKGYIILRPHGKGYLYFLVLALDTGVTDKHDITNIIGLSNTERKLSAYLEHYKNLS